MTETSTTGDLRELAFGPRLTLCAAPTPLEPLVRLAPASGPRLWVKREDCTGLAGGGNKVRKLEHLLGAARAEGADTILTAGAVQSNHARLTAAASARAGLACELFLNRRVPGRPAAYEQTGNVLLDGLLGARVTLLDGDQDAEEASLERAQELGAQGRRPYVIPVGGSNAIGARGYVAVAHELLEQARARGLALDAIVTATASAGTLAGLSVGLAHAGWRGRLLGISVSEPEAGARLRVETLALDTAARAGIAGCVSELVIDDRFVGDGYGLPTPQGIAAIRDAARLEGLLLDPVYSGKGMAGALAHLRDDGSLHDCADVMFVHTGGWPATFAYQEELR